MKETEIIHTKQVDCFVEHPRDIHSVYYDNQGKYRRCSMICLPLRLAATLQPHGPSDLQGHGARGAWSEGPCGPRST